jgi:NAD(P)-dependent dehydrogenase (short-subunit alcohol dehydrogenase family)
LAGFEKCRRREGRCGFIYGHRHMGLQLDDLNFEKHPYDKNKAYGQSKTATSLFALELDRRGQSHGVRAFSVHPGAILTDIFRYMSEEERRAWLHRASDQLLVPNDSKLPNGVRAYATDPGSAAALWRFSEEATGVKFF